MKKIIIFAFICLLSLSSCDNSVNKGENDVLLHDSELIIIHEETFAKQVINILHGTFVENYVGRKVKVEGFYRSEDEYFSEGVFRTLLVPEGELSLPNGITFHLQEGVYELPLGFHVLWDGKRPNNGDWVEAIGFLEACDDENLKVPFIMLNLTSLTILDERGLETITQ